MGTISDGYEMRDHHRHLLGKSRIYLLHNIRPTEILWSTFIQKEVLSFEMVDEIKARRTTSEKIGLLLDYVPARGPEAFDKFCEALLECDHAHVADYLKTQEATDQFRTDIRPHCADFSDHMLERFVSIFKRNTPMVTRFAERKFELILQEQEQDLRQKDCEVRELESERMMLQLQLTQLRNFLNTCYETSENVASEVQRDFISGSFIRDERKHLNTLKSSLKDLDLPGVDKVISFYNNILAVLSYLEKHKGVKVKGGQQQGRTRSARLLSAAAGKSIHEKLQAMVNAMTDVSDNLGHEVQVSGCKIRASIEGLIKQFKEIIEDVFNIRDSFKKTLRQKRKLECEVVSLLHNFQEVRRLEREQKEKQSHINDLSKHSQMLKKKTKHHRKQTDQVQLDIEQKKIQLSEIQKHLTRNIKSADNRMHLILQLLPDLEEEDFLRSDTELYSEVSSTCFSRPSSYSRPLTGHKNGLLTEGIMREMTFSKLKDKRYGVHSEEGGIGKKDMEGDAKNILQGEIDGKSNNNDAKDSIKGVKSVDESRGINSTNSTNIGSVNSDGRRNSETNNDKTRTNTDTKSIDKNPTDKVNNSVSKTNASGTSVASKLLDKRPKLSKVATPIHQRTISSNNKAIKPQVSTTVASDKKETKEEPEKKSSTVIGGMDIDTWLQSQQEQQKQREAKLQEQKQKIKDAIKEETERKLQMDSNKVVETDKIIEPSKNKESDKAIETNNTKDTNKEKVDKNVKSKDDREKSADSEKEKGWWETKGSASTRSSGSRPGSGTKSKRNSYTNVNDNSTLNNSVMKRQTTVDMTSQIPFNNGKQGQSKKDMNDTRSKDTLGSGTVDCNGLPEDKDHPLVKRSTSRTVTNNVLISNSADPTNFSIMNGEAIGLIDPSSNTLRQSFSNLNKEVPADLAQKNKQRQPLQTSKVELRLPSK